jgi:hypothetical protein
MNPRLLSIPTLSAVLAGSLVSVPFAQAEPVPVVQQGQQGLAPSETVAPLEQLVAPIALYPDALVALILPAATASSDVVLAARFLTTGGGAEQIDAQPWDDSVKGLAHYPDVVKWMDQNLSWTQQLGQAYLDEPQAVMNAIQRARAQAKANGILVDTPQQHVVAEDSYIRIVPAEPEVIYVPRYDPEVIYVERPVYYSPDPWISFGVGFGVGSWLAYDLDWRSCSILVDHRRHEHWNNRYDWRYRMVPGRAGFVGHESYWRPWQPLPGRPRPPHRSDDWHRRLERPQPFVGAPSFDRARWRDHSNQFAGRSPVDRTPNSRVEVQQNSGRTPTSPTFRGHGNGSAVSVRPAGRPNAPVVNPTRGTNPVRTDVVAEETSGGGRFQGRRPETTAAPVAPTVSAPTPAVAPAQTTVSEVPRRFGGDNRRRQSPENDHRIRPAMPNARPGTTVSVAPQPVVQPQAAPAAQSTAQVAPRTQVGPRPQFVPRPAPVMAGRQAAQQREPRVAESAPRVAPSPAAPQVDRQPVATGRADGGGQSRGGFTGGGRGGEGRAGRGDRSDR